MFAKILDIGEQGRIPAEIDGRVDHLAGIVEEQRDLLLRPDVFVDLRKEARIRLGDAQPGGLKHVVEYVP